MALEMVFMTSLSSAAASFSDVLQRKYVKNTAKETAEKVSDTFERFLVEKIYFPADNGWDTDLP